MEKIGAPLYAPPPSPAEDPPLPDGWTKHWSNTWKKHYWFDSKTGKQSWEAPTAANSAPHPPPEVGAKRAAPDAGDDGRNKMAKTEAEAPPPASKQQPAASNAVSAPSPAAKKPAASASATKKPSSSAGGLLGSILGSIEKEGATVDKAKIAEDRRRRKEAEDSRQIELKAARDNYRMFVVATLDAFMSDDRDVHEFQPTDNVHRLIVQDEAESRGMPSISQGTEGVDRRCFVFRAEKAPNERELRFLTVGEGTVAELLRRRSEGDEFTEYNIHFSLNDAKIVTKSRAPKRDVVNEEDEVSSRVVQNRAGNADAVADAAAKIQQRRREAENGST